MISKKEKVVYTTPSKKSPIPKLVPYGNFTHAKRKITRNYYLGSKMK